MLRTIKGAGRYLFVTALCIGSCAINGCVDSINYLASDSRLPRWFTLPPGLTRADVAVVRAAMQPRGADISVALYDNKYKKLEEVRGRAYRMGWFLLNVVNGTPEITGYKSEKDKHGDPIPYFFVVDDPALKRKILDEYEDPALKRKIVNENEGKLLADLGMDYLAIRKELLDEDSCVDH